MKVGNCDWVIECIVLLVRLRFLYVHYYVELVERLRVSYTVVNVIFPVPWFSLPALVVTC